MDGDSTKVTWRSIYDDFVRRHPNLSKEVIHWRPHTYATILLICKDGKRILYNYDDRRTNFI